MLPVKVFSACQKEIKLNSHWCLAFHGSIRDFTGFGPVKWCSASSGVVVTDHEVRALDLEKESNCARAFNFYCAHLCSYYLINWLLRSQLLISLKMKFFHDAVWCLVAFLLFFIISYTSAFQYHSWVIMQESPTLIKLNCLFVKMSFYCGVGAAAHIHTICSHADFPFFNF